MRRSTAKGIHPGAHVGVELILWLGGILTVAVQAYTTDWYQLVARNWELAGSIAWVYVALTQFSFLSLLVYVAPQFPCPRHLAAPQHIDISSLRSL